MPHRSLVLSALLCFTMACTANTTVPTQPPEPAPSTPTTQPIVVKEDTHEQHDEPKLRVNYEPPRAGKRYLPIMSSGIIQVQSTLPHALTQANTTKTQNAFKPGQITEVPERTFLERHQGSNMEPGAPMRRNLHDYDLYDDAKKKLVVTPIAKSIEALAAQYPSMDMNKRVGTFECMSRNTVKTSNMEICVAPPTAQRLKDLSPATPAMKWVVLEITHPL